MVNKILASFLVSFLLIIQSASVADGFWSWFGYREPPPKIDYSMGSSMGKLAHVPFEMRTKDEKFLLEAEKFGLTLSNLDVCQHKVMLHLRKSCSAMTEEEIAKVSVMLFNCQAAVEGRQTYPCTDDMTLTQCTQDMDKSTWNAYHIMSNRARSVCYATRQQEFVYKTEMAVNKLMFTAEHQIDSLQKIEDGQVKVKELTSQTLETVHAGQQELVERQEKLKTSQQVIQSFVSGNLRELTREKSLIAAGQKELSHMTELIQKRLDEASQKLSTNEEERQNNHQEILKDLAKVQTKAKEMWEKIDNSTQRILTQHAETALYYRETLNNLQRINETVTYLLQLVDQTRSEVDAKLGWLSGILDGAGMKLTVIYCCAVHGLYFLVAAVTATFLQIPSFSRIFMSLVIPVNAVCDANQITCLDFSSLTVVLVIAVAVHWLTHTAMHHRRLGISTSNIIYAITNRIGTTPPQRNPTPNVEHRNGRYPGLGVQGATELMNSDNEISHISTISEMDQFSMSHIESTPGSSTPRPTNNIQVSHTNVRHVKKDLIGLLENSRSTRSRSRTPNRMLGNSGSARATPDRVLANSSGDGQRGSPARNLCSGTKKSGSPCRANAISGRDFCHRHLQVSS